MTQPIILPGTAPRPNGWVTIRRRRDGVLMHTPAWAWARIEGKTEVADRVVDAQINLFGALQ